MAAGKEIKRLRGKKVTAAEAAKLIGVGVDKLRKWEERDTNPSDTGDIRAVEAYFGRKLADLPKLDSVQFNWTNGQKPHRNDPQDYISDLRDYNTFLKRQIEFNSGSLDQKLEKIMEVQIAIMEVLLAIAEEGGKKAAYNKTVAILKKRNLEGIFL